LPAPLKADAVRAKIKTAVETAVKAGLTAEQDIDAFIDAELPFAVGGGYGGDTSCVQIIGPTDEYIVCDTGSGLRPFGNAAIGQHGPNNPQAYHFFQSDSHWDHVMGFPFFVPAYIPGNKIVIYGVHDSLNHVFGAQKSSPHFPVDFKDLSAMVEFVILDPNKSHDIAGVKVSALKQNHPNDSYAYRFEADGKSVVYSTDCEHPEDGFDSSYPHVEIFKDADLLIVDAVYSLVEARTTKDDWGHASNATAVELGKQATVKHLMIFHHDPGFSDEKLDQFYADTVRYEELIELGEPMKVSISYDGLEVAV
jgi:phosphoribosyl 1,2-cyclic phosphodiesterase